ncbi:SHOCT domain-containing protein [Fusobacterium necrophorum]|nr:SHOCT domain-containing protein [Fusobacterium necrophorum]
MSSLHVDMAENAIKEAKTLLEQKNNVSINQTSAADEILKFKNLLDQGIITQDEFDKKKKELLGL